VGNFTIADNTIGGSAANSIVIGVNGVTTVVCSFNGIYNAATGSVSITNNTVQNATLYGTGASVYAGISNVGLSGTINITGNTILSGANNSTGASTGIVNSAAVGTANINGNVIRSHSRTTTTGTFIGISSTGAVTTALNINSNQLGNASGGLITYTVANTSDLDRDKCYHCCCQLCIEYSIQ
jgi:hypothetical protein